MNGIMHVPQAEVDALLHERAGLLAEDLLDGVNGRRQKRLARPTGTGA